MACRFKIRTLLPLLLLLVPAIAPETLMGQKRVYATVDPNKNEEVDPIKFDINLDPTDNIGSNIVFSQDGKTGYVGYTGSGVLIAFSVETGEVQARIETGGKPFFSLPLPDGKTLAVTSVLDNKVFLIDMEGATVSGTITFEGADFGFGSNLALAPDGATAYIGSTGSGHLIKMNLKEGREISRVEGMIAPAQVTLTPDGSIAIVVDTQNNTVEFYNTDTMTLRNTLRHPELTRPINFTAFNRAVLDPSGERGIIASRDINGILGTDTVIYFETSTGEYLNELRFGSEPGFTGLTPDGKHWLILNEFSMTRIPTEDFTAASGMSVVRGGALFSANMAFSADSKHVFYTTTLEDLVFQQEIETGSAVGLILVGDATDEFVDQPAHIAVAPNGEVAVLTFVNNKIDLLTGVYLTNGTKFISSESRFTGISLINTTDQSNRVFILALTNTGQVLREEDSDIVNPVEINFPPNNQISKTVAELFNFDDLEEREGWIKVSAEKPGMVGFYSVGDTSLTKLDGAPFFRETLRDWIVPEIFRIEDKTAEFNLVNPYYNTQFYRSVRFTVEGENDDDRPSTSSFPSSRIPILYGGEWPFPAEQTDGYMRFAVAGGLYLTEMLEYENAFGAINGIELARFDEIYRIYSPQFAILPGFKTILNVINASTVEEEEEDADAEITITLHGQDGTIIGEPYETTLGPNAQLKDDLAEIFKDDAAVDNVSGWLEVESSRDRIVGTVTFTNENEDFLSVFELSGTPHKEFLFPVVAKDANYNTGMAFLNNNPESAEIAIEVWGIGGTLDQATAITLAPGHRTAIYLSQLFPNMPSQLDGHLRIRSDQPLHSFSLINDSAFSFVLTLAPITLP